MSRPRGTEAIDETDVRRAFAMFDPRRVVTRGAIAIEIGCSASGLRDWHGRRGLSWATCVRNYSSRSTSPDGAAIADDDRMKAIYVPTDPQLADALRVSARNESRHPRDQAAVLIREALERRGALPTRNTRRPAAT